VNQRLAVGLLEKHGHTVTVAADGKQAVAALEHESFDMLLMDVQMPEMGGFEATGRIRESEKQTGKHLPIIAMTAYAMKGDRELCLASGMDGYVSKPIRAATLLAAKGARNDPDDRWPGTGCAGQRPQRWCSRGASRW
jgi:CheY-like chemotaxis protein